MHSILLLVHDPMLAIMTDGTLNEECNMDVTGGEVSKPLFDVLCVLVLGATLHSSSCVYRIAG